MKRQVPTFYLFVRVMSGTTRVCGIRVKCLAQVFWLTISIVHRVVVLNDAFGVILEESLDVLTNEDLVNHITGGVLLR